MDLFFGTTNPGKLRELRRLVAGLPVRVVSPDDLGRPAPEVEEDGATFEENARIKAIACARFAGMHALADDSGLCVDALNGMPGVLSARWSGRHGDDAANLRLVLAQVGDVPDERLGARFACAAALVVPGDGEYIGAGVVTGRLVREPRGSNGFGYDPIFEPDGYDLTTAEMDPADKDMISHRGRALRALAPEICRSVR